MWSRCLCSAAVIVGLAAVAAGAQSSEVQLDTDERFVERVNTYVELRERVERDLPRLPDAASPEQIEHHKQQLRARLGEARMDAPRGDLFTPGTEALIRQQLVRVVGQEDGASRTAINEENPGRRRIAINGDYPAAAQLSTVPPQVLLALPRLPDAEVEYRFMGRRLILLDARARMIVDYMEDALP